MKLLWTLGLVAVAVVQLPVAAHATTPRTITVDASLADFQATDRLPDDGATDSTLASCEVGQLFVTWDAQYLYLGYDFRADQAAVLYYVQGEGGDGATAMCELNAFPSAATFSEPIDVLVGHYSDQAGHAYVLSGGTATADSSVLFARTNSGAGTLSAAEVAIPWNALFPAAADTVSPNATVKIVGLVRGGFDGDAIVDANPDQPLNGQNCAATEPTLSAFHVIHVDADGNGAPDADWNPGADQAASCSGKPDGTLCANGTCQADSCLGGGGEGGQGGGAGAGEGGSTSDGGVPAATAGEGGVSVAAGGESAAGGADTSAGGQLVAAGGQEAAAGAREEPPASGGKAGNGVTKPGGGNSSGGSAGNVGVGAGADEGDSSCGCRASSSPVGFATSSAAMLLLAAFLARRRVTNQP